MTSVALEIDGKQVNGVSGKENDYMQNWIVNTIQHTIGPSDEGDVVEKIGNHPRRSQRKRKKGREPRVGNLLEKGTMNDPKVDLLAMYAKFLTPLMYPRAESPRCPCSNTLNGSNQSLPLPAPLLNVPNDSDTNNRTIKHLNRRKRQPKRTSQLTLDSDIKMANSKTSSTDEFASLPPFIDNKDLINHKKNNRRRFSDPGFTAQQTVKKAAPKPSNPNDSLIMCLVDHINLLKECNTNLHRELNKTKDNLETLKQQLSIWRGDSVSSQGQTGISSTTAYAPGMLADLVREIRDAAKIREEAMYTKVRLMLEEKISNKQNHVQSPQSDKSKINERLMHLEEELQNLRLSQSKDNMSAYPTYSNVHLGGVVGRTSSLEHDHLRLQLELNKERHAHAAADARANKLEMLVTQLQAKRGGTYTPVHANGTSTPDPRHLVMGPITDL